MENPQTWSSANRCTNRSRCNDLTCRCLNSSLDSNIKRMMLLILGLPLVSMSFLQTLEADQFSVPTFERHQFMMGALLRNDAFIEYIDDVGFLNGAESVGDRDGCSAFGGVVQCRLDHFLGLGVER